MPPFSADDRTRLAREALDEGVAAKTENRPSTHTKAQLTALAQAKLAFCERVFEVCAHNQGRAFASIVLPTAPRPAGTGLRKDYAYLFERFFLYLVELSTLAQGIVVFDELEKTQSHVLIHQMAEYFLHTAKGRLRSSRILPEPFFVHSDQTTLTQVADLIVYIISWGVRLRDMTAPPREDLKAFADAVLALRFDTIADTREGKFKRWSFVFLNDLRPRSEREE